MSDTFDNELNEALTKAEDLVNTLRDLQHLHDEEVDTAVEEERESMAARLEDLERVRRKISERARWCILGFRSRWLAAIEIPIDGGHQWQAVTTSPPQDSAAEAIRWVIERAGR